MRCILTWECRRQRDSCNSPPLEYQPTDLGALNYLSVLSLSLPLSLPMLLLTFIPPTTFSLTGSVFPHISVPAKVSFNCQLTKPKRHINIILSWFRTWHLNYACFLLLLSVCCGAPHIDSLTIDLHTFHFLGASAHVKISLFHLPGMNLTHQYPVLM